MMKKKLLLLLLYSVICIAVRANTESYTTWIDNGNIKVTVRIGAPDTYLKIQNGRIRIPISVSPSCDVSGTMVNIDFLKNGRSMTNGNGMGGLVQKDVKGYYLQGVDLPLYWSNLKDGLYKVVILPQPQPMF